MLQNMRKNVQGPAAKIIVWLIVISFSIFGIESILVSGGGGGVAEVNGEEISSQELLQAINTQKRRLISMMGDNIDPAMLDDDMLKGEVLESLIARKLLKQSAQDLDLTVSDRELGSLIGGMEEFQIEGAFSPQLFTSVLSNAGYTPAYFKETLRDDVALTQLRSGLAGSEFATPLEVALGARVEAEQRDLRFLTIPIQGFIEGQTAIEEDIKAYYATHQDNFRTEETLELDYIELAPEQFFQPVEENAIQQAYEEEIANTQYQTENRVSHILFEIRDGEDDDARAQRVSAAQARLADGADFGEVAGEFSDDIGSAASGGDLGFTSGSSFPEEMEEAIALLEVDQVSAPVETDAGIHLIRLVERREGVAPDLEEMRPGIEQQLKLAQARTELLRTVEELRDLVFNAEDLSAPAAELDLAVERSEPVARDQREGLFANPTLLRAAFSTEVLEEGHNSEVIELGDNRFVVMRVHRHSPPQAMELDDVREEISARIIEEAARSRVTEEAERIIGQLVAGVSIDQLANASGYDWQVELGADRRNTTLPREVLARVFEMPAPEEGESLVDFVVTPMGDAQVITLQRVIPGGLEAMERDAQVALQRQSSGETANLLNTEFQRGLRERADVSVM